MTDLWVLSLSLPQAFLSDPQYAEEEDLSLKLEMFKSEYWFHELFYHSHYTHTFWNEIIFACIADKYMEFDLNDNGEIGKNA